jgi:hypothetical protein
MSATFSVNELPPIGWIGLAVFAGTIIAAVQGALSVGAALGIAAGTVVLLALVAKISSGGGSARVADENMPSEAERMRAQYRENRSGKIWEGKRNFMER